MAGRFGRGIVLALVVAVVTWAFATLDFDLSHLRAGLSSLQIFENLFPRSSANLRHDWSLRTAFWIPFQETVQMAIVGTLVGAFAALPFSFLAARTNILPRAITGTLKTFLNVSRAIPTIVYALVALSIVGLGVTAGAIAIAFASFISLGKLYAEALESVSTGPIDAVRAVGGNSVHVFIYGMLPQVFPDYVSVTLYTFEYNLKDSFIVGIVGAGGLGAQLWFAFQQYHYLDAGVIILLLILLINLVDYGSYRLRAILA